MIFTILNKLNEDESINESLDPEIFQTQWRFVKSKPITDFDGFMTEYTWYTNGNIHIFMFGDSDLVEPDEANADWICEDDAEAANWFNSYNGFEEDNESDLLSEQILQEAFDNLPEWIITYLEKNKYVKEQLIKRGINLKTAIFEEKLPGNITPALLKDSNKLWILDLRVPSRWSNAVAKIYIPRCSSTDDEIYIGERYRKLSNVAVAKLIPMIARAGYIDLTDPSNLSRDIRNSRTHNSQWERNYKKAQYPHKINIEYNLKPDGSKDYNSIKSFDIEWLTHSGYDKNGYRLDPDKYIRLLNQVGCENCSIRLEKMYSDLESIRDRLLSVLSTINISDSHKYRTNSWNNDLFEDVGSALRTFSSILSTYKKFKDRVEALLNRNPRPENIDERIQNLFEWDARSISKDIRDLLKTIKALEHPERIPDPVIDDIEEE